MSPTRDTTITTQAAAEFLQRNGAALHERGAGHIIYKLPGDRWARTDSAGRRGMVRLRYYESPTASCPCRGG